MLSTLLELLGLALVGATLFLTWPPLLLAYVGVLVVVGAEMWSRR